MKKINFKSLEKKFPRVAKEFVTEQEMVVLFLNSPVRINWLKLIGVKKSEINKIMKVVEFYGKLKIDEENKRKPKTRKEIIKIEDLCLRKVFVGRIIKLKGIRERSEALKVSQKILSKEHPGSVILDAVKLNELSVLSGVDGRFRRFPTDFLVFDPKGKKVVSVDVIQE